MAQEQHSTPPPAQLDHPGARHWSPRAGCIGAALTVLIPLAMLVIGWSLRSVPNLPTPQLRPGKVPEAHWATAANLPTPRHDFGVAVVDGRIWILGGTTGTGTVRLGSTEVYDPATNSWQSGPALPSARSGLSATTIGQHIYVFGGASPEQGSTATVAALDTTTGQWRQRASLPTPLAGQAVAQLNGKVYIIGGRQQGSATDAVYAYDPAADAWRTVAPLPTPRTELTAVALNGTLYAIGGLVNGTASNIVEVYDPVADRWSSGPSLLAPMANFGATVLNGRIYAMDQRSHQMLDPRVTTWVPAEAMPTPRFGQGVVTLGDTLYAIGGSAATAGQDLGIVETYVPGEATAPDNFRLVGINRGGAIAVILGLVVTAVLVAATLSANRRRPSPGSRNPRPFDTGISRDDVAR